MVDYLYFSELSWIMMNKISKLHDATIQLTWPALLKSASLAFAYDILNDMLHKQINNLDMESPGFSSQTMIGAYFILIEGINFIES